MSVNSRNNNIVWRSRHCHGWGGGGAGSLHSPPAVPASDTFHHTVAAHMHVVRCCKQGCFEMADLANMKSSKERVKGTDYVNSPCLILQQYSIICAHVHLIHPV